MNIHIYSHAGNFTAFCYAPISIIGFSSTTIHGAVSNLVKHPLSLPPEITSFTKLKRLYDTFKGSPPKLISTFRNTSFETVYSDYPELFI